MAGGPAVRLYRAEWSTNCERVGLALAHKGIEAQSVLIEYANRRPVESISGQPLVPVIEDGGRVIFDSVAILRHLERRTPDPPLFPGDPAAGAAVDLFIDWFERVYKAAPQAIEAALESSEPDPVLIAGESARMTENLDLLERLLSGRDHLLGELGAADLIAYPFIKYAAGRDPADSEHFHLILDQHQQLGPSRRCLGSWIERMSKLPSAY